MNRPWHRWLAFATCLAVLLGALGWMTITLLRYEKAQTEMQHQAQLEERVRLALWRMDSALTALIVEESSRPASAYRAASPGAPGAPGGLHGISVAGIRLHFQRGPDGTLTSPQVAESRTDSPGDHPRFQESLESLRILLDRPAARPPDPRRASDAGVPSRGSGPLATNWEVLLLESAVTPGPVEAASLGLATPGVLDADQRLRNSLELQSRANVFQQATQQAAVNSAWFPAAQASSREAGALVFKALWLNGELLLARSVGTSQGPIVQGVWLDWPALRTSLLGSIRDLFPHAELRAVTPAATDDAGRHFATLPLELAPGDPADILSLPRSPLHLSLGLAWAGVVLAAIAAAALLHGTLSLSERRAAFVSAVTHELRTPLTTFKLYSEMLAEDMVTDPTQRKKYLTTLTAEATRLGHLVENVLAYARIERGHARQTRETLPARDLVNRLAPRLAERTGQAALHLVIDTTAPDASALLEADVAAVEQILFNLVDNACKYAAPEATERCVHLEVVPGPNPARFIALRVRDHGPGLSQEAARRLFRPFSRSAAAAARGVPGVGLGLALSRRLSLSLGGSLSHDSNILDGAAFVVRLPVARPPEQPPSHAA